MQSLARSGLENEVEDEECEEEACEVAEGQEDDEALGHDDHGHDRSLRCAAWRRAVAGLQSNLMLLT